jgi:Fe-S-cluster containining protein
LQLITDLVKIKQIANEKQFENDHFQSFLKHQNEKEIDSHIQELNDSITPKIDCTNCGNCCKSLMIHITSEETVQLSDHLNISVDQVKEQYIEQSGQGQMILNTVPCHFLTNTSCSIYEHRFTECREFPHLHKPHFIRRLFSTMRYYEICPIIFNVVEQLKIDLEY